MKIMNVKGCFDYIPEENNLRNFITKTLKEVFEKYGYNSIETPIINYYDMLSDKYSEENDILKEIYKLSDQGDRKLGLRYDLTVPFAKFIAINKNSLTLPFKRYEIAKVFRDGPVKKGRDREFTQCDVDVVGIDGRIIEAELLTLYIEAFKKLGIDIIIKYNNRKLMKGLIIDVVKKEDYIEEITTIIDKIEKKSKEEIIEELSKYKVTKNMSEKLLNLFNLSLDELSLKYKTKGNNYIKEGLTELKELEDLIKMLEIENTCKLTLSLARGQNYYTGVVFEVYDKENRVTSSIGGGGRYDNMITNYIDDGNKYPAVGISFGLSSIYEILKEKEDLKSKSNIDIKILSLDKDTESLLLATKLRKLGYKVELDISDRKLKKKIEKADRENIKYIIPLGENEVISKKFELKNLEKKETSVIDLEDLEKIKSII